MIKKRSDNNRQDDYGNIGTSFGNPGSAPDVPVSRTDESNKEQTRNDGDAPFATKIEFESDPQTPGIVDSPILDDSLDFRRISPMANLREHFTVASIKELCGIKTAAGKNSLSLLNVKKQKSKDKFDLENRAMIDRSKSGEFWGKDRPTQHITNQTGRIGSVKLSMLKKNDRIKVANSIMEVQSIEKDGVIARNVWNGFDELITGREFIRVQAATIEQKAKLPSAVKRIAAWFETSSKDDGMFDQNGGDHRDAALAETDEG